MLIDFGLGALLPDGYSVDRKTQIGLRGTPGYVPPEVGIDHWYSPGAVDVWSAGLVLLELLVGRRLIRGKSFHRARKKVLKKNFAKVLDISCPDEELKRILGDCLLLEPEKRPSSIRAFDRLADLAEGGT